jgi:hypothetical protein
MLARACAEGSHIKFVVIDYCAPAKSSMWLIS